MPNNRLALDAVSTMNDALFSVTPPTEISVTPPTEIDVLIEVDVKVDERKRIPSRATKRVLEHHVDETGYPDTVKEWGEYD